LLLSDPLSDTWCKDFGREICSPDQWLVWLRRVDNSVSFNRTFDDYEKGFGDKDGNFWLGLETLHQLPKIAKRKLKIHTHIEFWDGTERSTEHYSFSVSNETSGYEINVGSMDLFSTMEKDLMQPSNGQKFSSFDQDMTEKNCPKTHRGGWWYTYQECGMFFPTSLVAPRNEENSCTPYMFARDEFEEFPEAGIASLTMKIAPCYTCLG